MRSTPDALKDAIRYEVERQPYDLVIVGFDLQQDADLAEQILEAGDHHLLLVPRSQPVPSHALICVTSGSEPSKNDVLFAGRLVRHLGAEVTLLSVLAKNGDTPLLRDKTRRFQEGGIRALDVLGIPAAATIRTGAIREEIVAEAKNGPYDLLVMGAPLPDREGSISLDRLIGQVLGDLPDRAALIVRSSYTATSPTMQAPADQIYLVEADVL